MNAGDEIRTIYRQLSDLNRRLISVRASGGGGEANTASNVGAGGIGVFNAKVGIDLQFRNINAASARISVAHDAPNKEVDIDIVEAQVNHNALLNYAANQHVVLPGIIANVLTDHNLAAHMALGLLDSGDVGIADDDIVQIDSATVADNEYAKFTANGLEGRSYDEVLADLSGQALAAFDWNGQNLTNLGTGHDAFSDFVAAEHVSLPNAITNVLSPDGLGSGNELNNGNFEDWTAGVDVAPDGWTLGGAGAIIERAAMPKLGSYSAGLTRVGANCYLYQNIHAEKGIDYWKGRTVTFSCWIYCATANTARLQIDDGPTFTQSSYHTGNSTWQLLTVIHAINAAAACLTILCLVDNNNTTALFDGAMCVEGSYAVPYADKIRNWGHPSDYTLIDGKEIYPGTQAHIADADGNLADITTKFNTLLGYLENAGLLATS